MKHGMKFAMAVIVLIGCSTAWAAGDAELQAQIQALQNRVAELEAQQSDQSVEQRNAELVKQLMNEMANDPHGMAQDTGVTAGYDKRFFIKSSDDQFKLEFDTLLQFRHTYMYTDDGNRNLNTDGTRAAGGDGADSSASGFEVETSRLMLMGHVLKDLKYNITLEMDDDSGDNTKQGDAYLYTYELSYSFMPELGVKAGRFKGPFGKQEPGSTAKLQMVGRSLADKVFNIDRVSGVEGFGMFDMGDVKPEYRVAVFNGFRNNNDAMYSDTDNSPGAAGRLMFPLMGSSSADFDAESDIEFHENPVAMIGTSYAYANDQCEDHFLVGNNDSYKFLGKSAVDGDTDVFELGGETSMIGADASFKYSGLAINLEGFYQHVDVDSGEVFDAADFGNGVRTGLISDELDNYGWHAQSGYFIVPKAFELTSRVSGVHPDGSNDSYEYAGGWNWYLSGNDLKLSMDLSYIDDLPIVASSENFHGIQNNSLLLLRTQLQFQF
jgi:hypothetical protein